MNTGRSSGRRLMSSSQAADAACERSADGSREKFHCLCMKFGRCGCHHMAACLRIAARPACDDAACIFDDRDECLNVVRLKRGFDHEVDRASSKQRIEIAVAAKTAQAHL